MTGSKQGEGVWRSLLRDGRTRSRSQKVRYWFLRVEVVVASVVQGGALILGVRCHCNQ